VDAAKVEAATVEVTTVEVAQWRQHSGGSTVEVAINMAPVEVAAATVQGFFVAAEKSDMKNW